MSYQNVKDKLCHGHRKIANNTYLLLGEEEGEEYVVMKLHGYVIAIFYTKYLELCSAGWHTMTTKNRLNLALELAGIHTKGIFQQDWQWHYGNYNPNAINFREGIKISYTGEVLQSSSMEVSNVSGVSQLSLAHLHIDQTLRSIPSASP